jgi:hypothetical protein
LRSCRRTSKGEGLTDVCGDAGQDLEVALNDSKRTCFNKRQVTDDLMNWVTECHSVRGEDCSIAANDAHQVTWCRVQNLCIHSGEGKDSLCRGRTRLVDGVRQVTDDFMKWLTSCHNQYDKELEFFDKLGPSTDKESGAIVTCFGGIRYGRDPKAVYHSGDKVRGGMRLRGGRRSRGVTLLAAMELELVSSFLSSPRGIGLAYRQQAFPNLVWPCPRVLGLMGCVCCGVRSALEVILFTKGAKRGALKEVYGVVDHFEVPLDVPHETFVGDGDIVFTRQASYDAQL